MTTNDVSRITAIKAALIATTNTPGWSFVKQMANNIVQNTVQEALDEEDPVKGEAKRLKASALQRGFADLFKALEVTKAFDETQVEDDNILGDLETDKE